MESIESTELNAPITFLRFLSDEVLVSGSGPFLSFYNVANFNTALQKIKVLGSNRLYGLTIQSASPLPEKEECQVVFFGGTELAIAGLDIRKVVVERATPRIENYTLLKIRDWICDVSFTSLESCNFLILTGHNTILVCDRTQTGIQVQRSISTSAQPLLWSGRFSHPVTTNLSQLEVAVGTILNEVFFWSPFSDTDSKNLTCLAGHNGSLYGLAFSPSKSRVATASDDRTIRTWRKGQDEIWRPEASAWGHEGRVWRCEWVDEDTLLSVGEDMKLLKWDFTNQLPQVVFSAHVGHDGRSIWSLAASSDGKNVATGGADGGIRIVSPKAESQESRISPYGDQQIIAFDASSCGKVLAMFPDRSYAAFQHGVVEEISTMPSIPFIGGHSLVATTSQTGCIANSTGGIAILQYSEFNQPPVISHLGRSISALKFCTAGDRLLLGVYHRKESLLAFYWVDGGHQDPFVPFVLANIASVSPLTSYTLTSDCKAIFIGTKTGQLLSFDVDVDSRSTLDYSLLVKPHSDGITDIVATRTGGGYALETASREGTLKKHEWTTTIVGSRRTWSHRLLETIEISRKGWVEQMLSDGTIALCTKAVYSVVDRNGAEVALFKNDGWASRNPKVSIVDGSYVFFYLKAKKFRYQSVPKTWSERGFLKSGFMGREMRLVDIFCLGSRTCLITGAENATLRITEINVANGRLGQNVLSATNVGPLKAILCSPSLINHGTKLMFSGGAHETIRVNRLSLDESPSCDSTLRVTTLSTSPSVSLHEEVRLMCLDSISVEAPTLPRHTLAGAYSDGYLRIWLYDEKTTTFELLNEIPWHQRCVMSVRTMSLQNTAGERKVFAATGASDGTVALWDVTEPRKILDRPIWSQRVLQAGVDQIDIRSEGPTATVALAGDDGTIAIIETMISNGEGITTTMSVKVERAHGAAIHGLAFLTQSYLLTAALDQRVSLWKYSSGELDLVKSRTGNVADVGGMAVIERPELATEGQAKKQFLAAVGGIGLELFAVNIP